MADHDHTTDAGGEGPLSMAPGLPGPDRERLEPGPPRQPIDPTVPAWPWWRCYRLGSVSGRYEGLMTSPNAGRSVLDLRVDIDPRNVNSPVLNRLSGDVYDQYTFSWGGRTFSWRVFRYSWIVDAPTVRWSRCSVTVTGSVRRWSTSVPGEQISVTIPWTTFRPAGPATATFTAPGSTSVYGCARQSSCFRDVNLEVDVAASVNASPILPSYDTHDHGNRPSGLSQRTLTMEGAYDEAGICLTINPTRTVIDDSDSQFNSWSVAELHDVMETHFSRIGGSWPKWEMWGLLAGRFDNSGVGGIMFDAAAAFGGSGEPPERQGFAVFREHSWFDDLPGGAPANETEAAAMRKFLYTWVHEAGHAFNFLHSWNKSRPDALSWMNYDWRYDARNGTDSFWADFEMRFDDEELLHIRHGDRKSVIMGGDAWASGGHLEGPGDDLGMVEGNAPLELLVRSKGYFAFMEPVAVEVRLRNLLEHLPMAVDARLDPSFGAVAIQLMRPGGGRVDYEPVFCQLGDADVVTLAGWGTGQGADRHSQEVGIDFGKTGHYFAEPGIYRIRAVYQGLGDLLITSNVHTIRVGVPGSADDERLAQDYFTTSAGLAMSLGGSRSPYLASGFEALREVAARCAGTVVGARVARCVAQGLARAFFRPDENGRMHEAGAADPKEAIELTGRALAVMKADKSLSLGYHDLIRWRAPVLKAEDRQAEAKQEVATLRGDLERRGVKRPVLDDIEAFEKSL